MDFLIHYSILHPLFLFGWMRKNCGAVLHLLFGLWVIYVISTFLKRKKKQIYFSRPMDEEFLTQRGEKEKINSSNFSFTSHYKKFVFSFLFHPNKRKIFIFSFSTHPDKEHGNGRGSPLPFSCLKPALKILYGCSLP